MSLPACHYLPAPPLCLQAAYEAHEAREDEERNKIRTSEVCGVWGGLWKCVCIGLLRMRSAGWFAGWSAGWLGGTGRMWGSPSSAASSCLE